MSKNSPRKIYKSPPQLECQWQAAAALLKVGYKIVELKKKGGDFYCVLAKE